jgi:glucose/arabinose dehydrogenase
VVDAGHSADNASDDVTCGANDGWITGKILSDRGVFGDDDRGRYGTSLTGGRVAFDVSVGSAGKTICGTIDVADDLWHHVAVTRRFSDGRLRIYVDGVLDAEGSSNVGLNQGVSYGDNRAMAYRESDPPLAIGAGQRNPSATHPSYHGSINEVQLSTTERYAETRFARPFDLFSARRVALQNVISGLMRPVAIANAGDERLFIVEADGRILAYELTETGSIIFLDTFLDIRSLVSCCGERGLLGLAFHPNFESNGYFFVHYTRASDGDIVLARYQAPSASSNTVDPSTARILLTVDHSTYGNHNGGGIAFGPDGYLYVPLGDGGGGGDPLHNGQNLGALLGKILRLDIDAQDDLPPYYEIPPDNPFVGTQGARPEIWAWGLRNPWRIGFDRFTGDLFIADVGQDAREEVNLQPADSLGGLNYGWPRMEGTACYSPSSGCQTGTLVLPILDYSHAEGCSVIGGYRYRGAGIPTLNGAYVFGDFCSDKIWIGVQSPSGSWSRADLLATSFNISTFGEDSSGEIYVADVNGAIYRLNRVSYEAAYRSSTFSTTAGATLTVPITLTNTGSLTWDANNLFHLGYHWYQGSTPVTWEGVRTRLPSTVPPGGSITLQAVVTAPATAGAYTLKWDMLQQTTWFSQQGVTPKAVPVTVARAHHSTAPPIGRPASTSRPAPTSPFHQAD